MGEDEYKQKVNLKLKSLPTTLTSL